MSDPISQPANPLSQGKLAKAWGCTQPYISQLVKRGMPMTSLEDATAWRLENSKEGTGHKSDDAFKKIARAADLGEEVDDDPDAPPSEDSVESAIQRSEMSERAVHRLLVAAIKKKEYGAIPSLQRTHQQAVAGVIAKRREWEKWLMKSGKLVEFDVAENIIIRRLAPLDTKLRNFAKAVAARANPADPATAEREIQAELNVILQAITDAGLA